MIYEITSGRLYSDTDECLSVGYSGSPLHKNDADAQSLRNQGPIPEGTYVIAEPVDTLTHGPYVLPLTPDPANLMWGRSGFMIHGDSLVNPGTASEGCIIMPRYIREKVWNSGDRNLKVVVYKESA